MVSRFYRFGLYALVSLFFTVSVGFLNPDPGQARSWVDLLLNGVQVLQLSNISDRQEVALGQQIDRGLLQQGKITPVRDAGINEYINDIGQRLARYSERPDIPYTFRVVRDDSVNAFATMGGFVYIHSGLIKVAANEAELASVIAHEIGHIAARHSIGQMRNAAIARGVLSATGLDTRSWVQLGVNLVYNLPHSRQDELEADRLGLNNLIAAGYAPSAMVSFLEKLLKKSGSTPSFLSTHPATEERIERLQAEIDSIDTAAKGGLDRTSYRSRVRALL
ncbi:M48 family metallopeptidase [Pannus brasiliensis CCIBt3594]|uniref:M48 family metallopeptidase n=1 Tax=Pannus brasiliensis CCIBt3594 TaxID=1427578 RepID=A0AAW9QXZ4_9CHRO